MTWIERASPAGEAEETKEETRANARLIAAAPGLLTELRRLRKRFHACCIHAGNDAAVADAACASADAAIAKAVQS